MTNTKISNPGSVFSYMRWSSEPQSWGDSQRRQAKAAQDWCERNGKTLSDRTFMDRGVSARKGLNREKGQLADLLEIAQSGDIILIEDNDRFSREDPITALSQLRDKVLNKGVKVVFLKTGVEVTRDNFNQPSILFPNFFQGFLANAENEKRVSRIRSAMQERREKIESGKAVPGSMPCWLRWDVSKGAAVIDEIKADSVRKLFQLSLEGWGVQSIQQELMRNSVPCPSNSKRSTWNTRLIHRLLNDKGVIGWHTGTGTPGVYPPIVTEETFYASCRKMASRKKFSSPKKFANGNLFTGLLKCSVCGGSLIKCGSGHNKIYYSYLCCADHQRGWKKDRCKAKGGLPYDRLEESFLALLARTDLVYRALAAEKITLKLDSLRDEMADVQKQCEKYLQLINDEENPSPRLKKALDAWEVKERTLQTQIDTEETTLKSEVPATKAYEQFQAEFAEHVKEPAYRARVREALKDIVESIVVELGTEHYQVRLRSASMPIDVILGPSGWLFNPSPRVAVGDKTSFALTVDVS